MVSHKSHLRSSLTRRALTSGLVTLPFLGPLARATAKPSLTPDERAHLNKISAYINTIQTMRGRFVQVASNGVRDSGTFQFRRPGRLRFDYEAPNPHLVLSNGRWVVIYDRKMDIVDRFPFTNHPLKVIMRKNVDLAREGRVVALQRIPGMTTVVAQDDEGLVQGALEIIFAEPALEILQWKIVDAQGFAITIALKDVEQDIEIDNAVFKLDRASENLTTEDFGLYGEPSGNSEVE